MWCLSRELNEIEGNGNGMEHRHGCQALSMTRWGCKGRQGRKILPWTDSPAYFRDGSSLWSRATRESRRPAYSRSKRVSHARRPAAVAAETIRISTCRWKSSCTLNCYYIRFQVLESNRRVWEFIALFVAVMLDYFARRLTPGTSPTEVGGPVMLFHRLILSHWKIVHKIKFWHQYKKTYWNKIKLSVLFRVLSYVKAKYDHSHYVVNSFLQHSLGCFTGPHDTPNLAPVCSTFQKIAIYVLG